jgi:hypothetical protein
MRLRMSLRRAALPEAATTSNSSASEEVRMITERARLLH